MQQVLAGMPVLVQPSQFSPRDCAIDFACALFACLPLVLTSHLPLYDMPNHIAMLHVLLEQAGNPVLRTIYGVHWAFIPNMGLQAAVWLLSPLFSVELSVRLFCISVLLLLCAGTKALSLALAGGDPGLRLYRAAPLLCWGAPLQYGFASYCFGIGLLLAGVAAYVRLRPRRWPLLVVIFVPFSIVLLATHLIAFGLFVASLSGLELGYAFQRGGNLRSRAAWLGRRAGMVASLTLPALLVLRLAPPLGNTAAPNFAHPIMWSTPYLKGQSIAAITWFAMPRLEVALLLAAVGCLALALWYRLVYFGGLMLGMVCVLGVLWLILPRSVPAGHYVDYRVPWAISFIILAGLMANKSRQPHWKLRRGLACALAGLVFLRVGSICWRALRWEPEIAAVDRALSALPLGTKLLVIRGLDPRYIGKTPPLEHTPAFIVTRRHGFEPEVFAGTAGDMVYLKQPYRDMYQIFAPTSFRSMPAAFDATIILNPSLVPMPHTLDLHCAAAGPDFWLLTREGAPSACR